MSCTGSFSSTSTVMVGTTEHGDLALPKGGTCSITGTLADTKLQEQVVGQVREALASRGFEVDPAPGADTTIDVVIDESRDGTAWVPGVSSQKEPDHWLDVSIRAPDGRLIWAAHARGSGGSPDDWREQLKNQLPLLLAIDAAPAGG